MIDQNECKLDFNDWEETGDAMVVPFGEERTIPAKTYDTPLGMMAIDERGNRYLVVIDKDENPTFHCYHLHVIEDHQPVGNRQ